MITDPQVRKLQRLVQQGLGKERAALKAGMDPNTARKYRRLGRLPSEVKTMDRNWRTRSDPFDDVWPQILELLRDVTVHPSTDRREGIGMLAR